MRRQGFYMNTSLGWLLPFLFLGHPNIPAEPLPPGALLRFGSTHLRHWGDIGSVAVAPDGKLMATADADGVRLWDMQAATPPLVLSGQDVFAGPLAFSADGRMLAGTKRSRVVLWEIATKTRHQFGLGHNERISSLAFSPDGTVVAAGDFDGTIGLWNTKTGKERFRLDGHNAMVSAVVFVPGRQLLISAGDDATVHFWDTATGKKIKELAKSGHDECAYRLAVSADGKLLAIAGAQRSWGGDGRAALRVVEIGTGKERFQATMKNRHVHAVAFAPDGKTVAGGVRSMGGAGFDPIHLWDTATGKPLGRLRGHSAGVTGVFFMPDGKTMISSSYDSAIRMWNIADGRELTDFHGHLAAISGLAYSPDGKVLATGGYDEGVCIWDATTGKRLHVVMGHYDVPRQLIFTPDSKHLLSLAFLDHRGRTSDTTARLWNVKTGELVRSFDSVFSGIAMSPDGRLLAHGSYDDHQILIRDLATGDHRVMLAGHDIRVSCVAFSPDGTLLASVGEDSKLRVWKVKTGRQVLDLGLAKNAQGVVFSPDGRLVLASCDDGKIYGFEVATGLPAVAVDSGKAGKQQIRLACEGRTILVLACDGRTIRVADLREETAMWIVGVVDLVGGQFVAAAKEHAHALSAAVAPDGKAVALGSKDGTVTVWPVQTWVKMAASPVAPLSTRKMEQLWPLLADFNGASANAIHWQLVANGDRAVAWLRARLRPVAQPDAKALAQRFAELGDERFKVREQAMAALEKWRDTIEVPLQKILQTKPPLEIRLRVEKLLTRIDLLEVDRETLRLLRAIAILKAIDNTAARELLQEVANGAPGARATEAARAALQRLPTH
jgi:WD40 repeat protein